MKAEEVSVVRSCSLHCLKRWIIIKLPLVSEFSDVWSEAGKAYVLVKFEAVVKKTWKVLPDKAKQYFGQHRTRGAVW